MISISSKLDLPLVTVLSGVLFIDAYFFKLGEAVYFGYPSYYMSLDLTSVINIALKLLVFFGAVMGGVVCFFGDDGRLQSNRIKLWLWFAVAVTIIQYFFYIKAGVLDPVKYLSGGLFVTITWLAVYFSTGIVTKKNESFAISYWPLMITAILMMFSSFLAGINYHNQVASSLWLTEDNKIVVGEYNGLFVLKECVDGRGVFYLKEMKDSKFIEVQNYIDGKINPRCYKKNKEG